MKTHQKKYYGSLFVIMFLIVATAMLLTNSGNNDVTGMATLEEGNQVSYLYYDSADNIIYEDFLYYHNEKYYVKNSETDKELGKGFSSYEDALVYMNEHVPENAKKTVINLENDFAVISTYNIEGDAAYIRSKIADETTNPFNVKASTTADVPIVSKAGNVETFEYAQDTKTLTVEVGGYTYKYDVVEIGGQYYAKKTTTINGVETTFYTDKEGMIWKYDGEKLVKSSAEGTYNSAFVDSGNKVLPIFSALLQEEKERTTAAKKMETYNALAAQIDPSGQITGEDLYGEETAINAYLSETVEGVTYDVTTGHYEGTMSYGGTTYVVDYHNDDIGITTTVQNQKGESVPATIYKDTSSIPPTYYTLGDKGQRVSYKPDESIKSDLRKAEHAVEDVEEDIEKEMQKCAKASSDEGCQLTYETADGRTIRLDATARQEAFMNRLYAEQEAKVQGLIAGWLNGWIDEKLGGWSRGVPAGICANIFGLEYYKQDGWTRVAMNSSVDQLQSTLIDNSRTVIIEGEKEEITEEMFRYAYTIKLLANQSIEWQTYLYNSCTQETSVETFYDYGSLAAGGYFAFHYAGAGTQDMIFECEEEICLYDQACVVFADGTEPTCVSLVHGAGFETPVAGNDYDCAITG